MQITSTATPGQITEFLDRLIADWPRDPYYLGFAYYNSSWSHDPMANSTSPATLVEELLANTEFRTLQLGTWLNRPDMEALTSAVEAISPPPYRQDIELITEALKLAAQAQRDKGIGRALATSVAALGFSLLVSAIKN